MGSDRFIVDICNVEIIGGPIVKVNDQEIQLLSKFHLPETAFFKISLF